MGEFRFLKERTRIFQISWLPDETLCHQLTAFVFAADPKSQKNGSHAAHASAPTNVDARTKLKDAERELRNTAGFATEDSRAKRQPRVPAQLISLKLQPVRRAHSGLSKATPVDFNLHHYQQM
jgi:hypothetical protein